MKTKKPELSSERLLDMLAAASGEAIRLPLKVSASRAGFAKTARTDEVGNLLLLVRELLLLKDSDKTMLL